MLRLPPGSILGRYEVVTHLGSGGMGDVYRARDTHLSKTVALKTISAAFATDPSSLPRFERERRLTAALEHPHICRLLDAGREAGVDYLAMEYLEGESLAARLTRGPLPVPAAMGYAIEIADALHYAHQHGVVHRDLKPGNVFLTGIGAKVLDFGLAKLRPTTAGDAAVMHGDTVPLDATAAGTLVGSAPYMAPERLEGHDADHRTDVFGFGVLLYEMLTGRRAFDGSSPAALIAAILSSEPPSLGLHHPKGAELEWVVRRCLAKQPDDRWQSMADVAAVLKRIAAADNVDAPTPSQRGSWLAAMLILIAISAAAVWAVSQWRARHEASHGPIAMAINPPIEGTFTPTDGSLQTVQLAMSPDGRSLAFVAAAADGASRLWIRKLSSIQAVPLQGTEDARFPFWSPDSRSLGFFSGGSLRRIDLAGGRPRTLAAARNGRGGTWNAADEILFTPNNTSGILRVSANGTGTPVEATHLDTSRGETSHRWPIFLPDGRRFLYFARAPGHPQAYEGIYLGSLDGAPPKLIVNTNAGGVFLPPDQVLFVDGSTLLARSFNLDDGKTTSTTSAIARHVGTSSNFYAAVSASSDGIIAYASSAMTSDLVWVDRRGRQVGTASMARQHVDFRLSPDGRFAAIAEVDPDIDRSDIFVLEFARGEKRRVTATPATDASPVWSPDSRKLVFRSSRQGPHDLFFTHPDRSQTETLFQASNDAKYATSWSPDGQLIAFHVSTRETSWDVMVADTREKTAPRPFVKTRFAEVQPQFSPDQKWMAYTSDQSGRQEIYVQSLERPNESIKVSENGGSDPRWRSDGTELFYVSATDQLTAVKLRQRANVIEPTGSEELFPVRDVMTTPPFTSTYDVAPDGQRFLIRVPREDVRTTPLQVLLNWPLQ